MQVHRALYVNAHGDLGKINFTYFLLEVALQKCLLPPVRFIVMT